MIASTTDPIPRPVRVDLHCHSIASSHPAEAMLKAINCPECYSDPRAVHAQAKARGMDFVTITDHDCIDGALKLEDLPDTFVGEELTCWFPEDGCKMHVVLWGISQQHHDALQSRARNIYDVAEYVEAHRIAHAVAHPIYRQNEKLERWHLERLMLIFKGFECLNGAHSPLHREAFEPLLDRLDKNEIDRLSLRHDLKPRWPDPWIKSRTGGSDDHGLLNIGRTWTEFPPTATTPAAVLECLRTGDCRPGGEPGSALKLAHTFYSVAVRYYTRHILKDADANLPTTLLQLLVGDRPAPTKSQLFKRSLASRLRKLADNLIPPIFRRRRDEPPTLRDMFLSSARHHLAAHPALREALHQNLPPLGEHEQLFSFVSSVNRDVTTQIADAIARSIDRASFTGLFNSISSILAQQFVLSPYYFALFHQNKERRLLHHLTTPPTQRAPLTPSPSEGEGSGIGDCPRPGWGEGEASPNRGRSAAAPRPALSPSPGTPGEGRGEGSFDPLVMPPLPLHTHSRNPPRLALFTDTFDDINGVSRFLNDLAAHAHHHNLPLTIHTCTASPKSPAKNRTNFPPVLSRPLPGYPELQLNLPPLLEILEYADRQQYDAVHVSTPGPMGLVGLLVSKMLRVPLLGTYHTDFPAYAEHLTADHRIARGANHYMRWFYNLMHTVFARSADYRASLQSFGLPPDRLALIHPSVNTTKFNPTKKDPALWTTLNIPHPHKLLYAGRVSVEKNLPFLADLFRRLCAVRHDTALVIAGDGPYREKMLHALRGLPVHFLGYQDDAQLARLYASADLLLFPSTTDTLGQVVMEAQASALPALVSDEGGPKEIVADGLTGLVLPAHDPARWSAAIDELLNDPPRRLRMARTAAHRARRLSPEKTFEAFWSQHLRAALDPDAAIPTSAAHAPALAPISASSAPLL